MMSGSLDEPVAYGIDFGTSNSTIAVAYPDRTKVLLVEPRTDSPAVVPSAVVPSLVYLHRNRDRDTGDDAAQKYLITGTHRTKCGNCALVHLVDGVKDSKCRQYKDLGECFDSRILSGVKSYLASTEFGTTHSWAQDFTLDDIVSVVLSRLKLEADKVTGADVRRVVLGHPVSFPGAEGPEFRVRQEAATDRLVNAARNAGFTEIELLPEPVAAMNGEDLEEGYALAADIGGGTLDISIIQFSPDGGVVRALTGAEIGGETFNKLMFNAKVAPELGLTGIPGALKDKLGTLHGLNFLLQDAHMQDLVKKFLQDRHDKRMYEILRNGHSYEFYREIEQAKVTLSTQSEASIEFHRPKIDISITVRRTEFEDMIAEPLNVVRDEIKKALSKAKIVPQSVTSVLRTGGSSSIPAFVRVLEEFFNPAIIEQRPVYTTVAEGLARQALELWP